MKIQILNSPFDFDEVGQKTAQRWIKQKFAELTADGLILRPRHTAAQAQQIREDDEFDRAVTGVFEPFVSDSGNSYMQQIEGIGGTRVLQMTHGN